MSASRDETPRLATTVPLVSPRLALSVGLTSLPVFLVVVGFTLLEGDPWWVVALAALFLFGPIPLLSRLRFAVDLSDDALRYRVRPWHLRPRVVPLASVTSVDRLGRRPDAPAATRRVNLGRGWVEWTDAEVRYVLDGETGLRVERSDGRAVELWVSDAAALARELDRALAAQES